MQNTHASFDHKGSCWCIKIWICMRVCVCYFFFVFYSSSPRTAMPSLHQLRWHNSLRDVKMSVCAWLYYVRTKMQQNDNRWSSISCFISKMIFINFGFYNSLLCFVVSVLMFFVTLLFSQSIHGSRWKGSNFFLLHILAGTHSASFSLTIKYRSFFFYLDVLLLHNFTHNFFLHDFFPPCAWWSTMNDLKSKSKFAKFEKSPWNWSP